MFDDVFTRKSVSEEDYEVLGLTSSATLDEVTNRYHVLSKKNHPDAEDGSSFIFKQIVAAYERIRADRVGSSHQPPLHSDSASGRDRSWPFRQSAGSGPPTPGSRTPTSTWAWWVTRAGQWRWAWVTVVVLALLAVIGTLSFTRGGDSDGAAASVATTTLGTTPRSAPTRAIETPARPPAAATPAAVVPTTTEPSTTVLPPVACPTATLTATGGVSVVTDSITSGQWEAVVSGIASNHMSAPVVIVSTEVQLEDQNGSPVEPPIAAGGGGTTLNPGQSISIDDNQVQTVASSGLPRVVSALINWEWPASSPFGYCPHNVLAVPNVG